MESFPTQSIDKSWFFLKTSGLVCFFQYLWDLLPLLLKIQHNACWSLYFRRGIYIYSKPLIVAWKAACQLGVHSRARQGSLAGPADLLAMFLDPGNPNVHCRSVWTKSSAGPARGIAIFSLTDKYYFWEVVLGFLLVPNRDSIPGRGNPCLPRTCTAHQRLADICT